MGDLMYKTPKFPPEDYTIANTPKEIGRTDSLLNLKREFPSQKVLEKSYAIIIPGSTSSTNDKKAWIAVWRHIF